MKETLLREGGEERINEEEDGGEKMEVCPVKPSDRRSHRIQTGGNWRKSLVAHEEQQLSGVSVG